MVALVPSEISLGWIYLPPVLLVVSLGVLGLAALGIARLRVDSYSLAYFYDDHEIKRHDRALLDTIGPYLPLELVLRTPVQDGVKDPAVLQAMEEIIRRTESGIYAVRLSAGREEMNEEMHALAYFAGANSIFYGEKLLTTPNPRANADMALFDRLGIQPEQREVEQEPETPSPRFYDAAQSRRASREVH